MKKILLSFLFLLLSIIGYSQAERYPVFPACESEQISNLPSCFKNQVKEVVLNNFIIPENVIQENFKGIINVVFLVDDSGNFKVLYVNSPFKELKDEVERVFKTLTTITPAKFNNHNSTHHIKYNFTHQLI